MAIPQGTMLGRYEIRSLLGAGGMGEVYLADDPNLHRRVAIKVLSVDVTTNKARLERFEREAFAASSLNHPNILTIYEIGHESEHHFIVTEFIEGESLGQLLASEQLSLHEVLDIGIQVASALSAAHANAIMHRDIKPDNIMVRRDHLVKVLDFGLAKLSEIRPSSDPGADTEVGTRPLPLTTPGVVMGTARYMSPEQARGLPLDHRTDIWSFGVVLYEMVAGRPPFTGKTMSDVIASLLKTEPPAVSKFAPEMPAEFERIVMKALRKDQEERYQAVKELGLDLKSLKQRLEFEVELERSGSRTRNSVGIVSNPEPGIAIAERQTAETVPAKDVSTVSGSSHAHTTSSDKYVVAQIKRHKLALLSLAALVALTIAGGLYWRSHKSIVLTEKDTIVVADFVNTTGDAAFDNALRTALAMQLRQTPFINVLSDDRVKAALKLMGRRPDERLTQEVAREICQRTNGTALLTGSIASAGDRFVIAVKTLNCGAGNVLARSEVEAENRSQVVKALGEAGNQIRQKLGESLPSLQKYNVPLEQVTTSSIEALQAFTQGYQVANTAGNYPLAIEFFQRAVTLDPNFATAYAELSACYFNIGKVDKAAESARKAHELRHRVSERERFYIASEYETKVTGNLDAARKIYLEWEQSFPRDEYPPGNLAVVYNMLGHHEKSFAETQKSLRLDPGSGISYGNLVYSYILLNRLDEAKATAREAQSLGMDSPQMHGLLHLVAFLQKDQAEMERHTSWLATKGGWEAAPLFHSRMTALFYGQFSRARELAQQLAQRSDSFSQPVPLTDADSALRAALVGDMTAAKRQAESAMSLKENKQVQSVAALAQALAGESTRVTKMADALAKRFPEDTLVNFVHVPLIHAAIALQSGDAAKAVEALSTGATYELGNLQIVYLRGQAYLTLGNSAAAAVEFQKIIDRPGVVAFDTLGPLAQLGLGRAYARAGDKAKATIAYQDFFSLWKDADPDIPILREAKAEYEKLR